MFFKADKKKTKKEVVKTVTKPQPKVSKKGRIGFGKGKVWIAKDAFADDFE
jgi:hypothetical protein